MQKPIIVCLCGSTRFYKAYAKIQLEETLAGRIVLTVGSTFCSDDELIALAENNCIKKAYGLQLEGVNSPPPEVWNQLAKQWGQLILEMG